MRKSYFLLVLRAGAFELFTSFLILLKLGRMTFLIFFFRKESNNIIRQNKQTELGQAQLKLGLDFNFCRFGFFGFSLIDLVWYKFDLVDLVWYIGFCKLGSLAS